MSTRAALLGMMVLLLVAAPGHAQAPARRGRSLEHVADSARSYKAGLERMAPIYEADLRRVTTLRDRAVEMRARGEATAAEVEAAERLVGAARLKRDEMQKDITRVEILIAETEARKALLALPPPKPDEYRAAGVLIRYSGTAPWRMSDIGRLGRFFWDRFGRTLPVSAIGQTPVHDRLGLDHRNAVDIALHPDSVEARALMAHLRELRIPFIAYRGAVSGSATGAHIHVGEPSYRIGLPR